MLFIITMSSRIYQHTVHGSDTHRIQKSFTTPFRTELRECVTHFRKREKLKMLILPFKTFKTVSKTLKTEIGGLKSHSDWHLPPGCKNGSKTPFKSSEVNLPPIIGKLRSSSF